MKKRVPIQLYKVCWNKCYAARLLQFCPMTLSKNTCSNKLGWSKIP